MTSARKLNGIYATWDGGELDFSMSMGGLSELTHCFKDFAYGTYQLESTSAVRDSDVAMIDIRHGEERLRVSFEQDRVLFIGNTDAMSLLADNMAGLLSLWAAGGDQHFHFDPASDHLLLDPDSEAFILSPLGQPR